MFERFTQEARQVVVLAQEEARSIPHNYIGTEHILLGLIRAPGIASPVLATLGMDLQETRVRLVSVVGPSATAEVGQIPFTPRAKKVLELALREALSLGSDRVDTEHILLGLVRENEGVASRLMDEAGAIAPRVRQKVIEAINDPARPRPPLGPEPVAKTRRAAIDPAWLGDISDALPGLGAAIRAELGREPDSGDLLLAIASGPDSAASRALRELGVDLDALAAAIERHRAEQSQARQSNLAELRRRLRLQGS